MHSQKQNMSAVNVTRVVLTGITGWMGSIGGDCAAAFSGTCLDAFPG